MFCYQTCGVLTEGLTTQAAIHTCRGHGMMGKVFLDEELISMPLEVTDKSRSVDMEVEMAIIPISRQGWIAAMAAYLPTKENKAKTYQYIHLSAHGQNAKNCPNLK